MTAQRFPIRQSVVCRQIWPPALQKLSITMLIVSFFSSYSLVYPRSVAFFAYDSPSMTTQAVVQPDTQQLSKIEATQQQFAAQAFASLLTRYLPEASTVVHAQVLDAKSAWNAARTKIVTKHQLKIIDALWGNPASFIEVETDGGYLVEEALGLWVSHDARLDLDTPLLLLLAAEQEHYRVVGGDLGVLTVTNGQVRSNDLQLPIGEFVPIINRVLAETGQPTTVAAADLWAANAMADGKDMLPVDQETAHDDQPRWIVGSAELAITVNLNSAHINDAEQPRGAFYMAIARALYTWSAVEGADFTLLYAGETDATETGYNGENEIVFRAEGDTKPLGQAQLWYTTNNVILEVDLWINDDYNLSVADQPAFGAMDLESIVLHELGHWVPLDHDGDPDAVMYSVLAPQQVRRELTENEINRLAALYPCPLSPCVHLNYQDELPTPTATPTPNAPTATPTPTLVPTSATPTLLPTRTTGANHPIYLPLVLR